MSNFAKASVSLAGLLAGLALLGSAFVKPASALTLSNDEAPRMSSTVTSRVTVGNVITLPEVVITGTAHETVGKDGLLPFHPERCAALVARFGKDADYRCPRTTARHSRSAPTGKVSRTFVHTLAQGGSPDAPTVVVHEYQDAE